MELAEGVPTPVAPADVADPPPVRAPEAPPLLAPDMPTALDALAGTPLDAVIDAALELPPRPGDSGAPLVASASVAQPASTQPRTATTASNLVPRIDDSFCDEAFLGLIYA